MKACTEPPAQTQYVVVYLAILDMENNCALHLSALVKINFRFRKFQKTQYFVGNQTQDSVKDNLSLALKSTQYSGAPLPVFWASKALKPFIPKEFEAGPHQSPFAHFLDSGSPETLYS